MGKGKRKPKSLEKKGYAMGKKKKCRVMKRDVERSCEEEGSGDFQNNKRDVEIIKGSGDFR